MTNNPINANNPENVQVRKRKRSKNYVSEKKVAQRQNKERICIKLRMEHVLVYIYGSVAKTHVYQH